MLPGQNTQPHFLAQVRQDDETDTDSFHFFIVLLDRYQKGFAFCPVLCAGISIQRKLDTTEQTRILCQVFMNHAFDPVVILADRVYFQCAWKMSLFP